MLEEYVSQQVRDGSYDLDANMALLKLYQFYPDRVRHEVSKNQSSLVFIFCSWYWIQLQIILAVLLKGMMRLPEPDFVMYKALLSSLNDPDMDKNVKRALGKWH